MNSMRASPTPSAGNCHHFRAAAGFARLSMTRVLVFGILSRFTLLTLNSPIP